MYLSQVFEEFYVIPLNQSELVTCVIADPGNDGKKILNVSWTDSETGTKNLQVFEDQEVQPCVETPGVRSVGSIMVETVEGDEVGFLVLEAVSSDALFGVED